MRKLFILHLKSVRKKRNLTQKKMAEYLNTTQQTYSAYENGVITPSLDRLVEIAQILNVTLDELVTFKQLHSDYSKELKEINEET